MGIELWEVASEVEEEVAPEPALDLLALCSTPRKRYRINPRNNQPKRAGGERGGKKEGSDDLPVELRLSCSETIRCNANRFVLCVC